MSTNPNPSPTLPMLPVNPTYWLNPNAEHRDVIDASNGKDYRLLTTDGALAHYIETIIVYPMGSRVDPDLSSFQAYQAFKFGADTTPLDRVLKRIRDFQQMTENDFFRDVSDKLGLRSIPVSYHHRKLAPDLPYTVEF